MLSKVGALTVLDRPALAAYCQAYGRWVQIEQALAALQAKIAEHSPDDLAGGLLMRTAKGFAQNPLLAAADSAAMAAVRLAGELGLTPASRSRVRGGAALRRRLAEADQDT